MENPTIVDEREGRRGAFHLESGGERLGKMTYSLAGGVLTVHHTEVHEKLRGTGGGARLVEAAVQKAREEGLRIVPRCPFARRVFERRADYADVFEP